MDLVGQCNVPVRIHSECLTGDVLSSEKCDCGQQRNNFLKRLDEEANGVFIYIKGHEGRGAGLLNKVRAYGLMDKDPELHHNSALKCCGCESDTRNYHQAMCALQELGMASILLHTNNQFKVEAAKLVFGAECVHKVGIPSVPTQSSHKYLSEKEQDCGHIGLLSEEDSAAAPRSGSMLSTVEVGGSSCERKGGANQANPVDDPAMLDGQEVSTQSYAISDVSTGAKGWYDDHGWTVIRDVLPQAACGELIRATEDHKKECAAKSTRKNAEGKHVHIPYDEYRKEISQHRDLHLLREQGVTCFVDTLRKAALDIVLPLTGWSGATLFHDHVINKPRGGSNGAIPGHQDSMFWPIDRPGISVWLALEDIGPTGGCLEVVDQSHKSGTCEDPVDFMAKEVSFSNRFPGVPQFRLPAKAGSAVLLDSLTFHRSSPNQDLDGDRFVYLMLFVPFCARWEPALVDWHPINSHLMQSKFPEHERLRLEALRHPSFGTCGDNDDCCKATPTPLHCGTHAGEEGITMYNAAPKTTTQLKQILGELNSSKSGAELLTDETVYEQVFEVLRQTAVCHESQVPLLCATLLCFHSHFPCPFPCTCP